MNLEERAKNIISIKSSLKSYTKFYYEEKKTVENLFKNLLVCKYNLKKMQILYWNRKELRADDVFMSLYDSTSNIYNVIKKEYKNHSRKLKTYKIIIKDRQKQISKMAAYGN